MVLSFSTLLLLTRFIAAFSDERTVVDAYDLLKGLGGLGED